MKKRILALFIAMLMVLAAMPQALALPKTEASSTARFAEQVRTAPQGYDEHDYNALVNFLEQTDEDGVKNGFKLSQNYNISDPATWTGCDWTSLNGIKFINTINMTWMGVVGTLDLSQCLHLERLECRFVHLTALNVTQCPNLELVYCDNNESLAALDVTQCPNLILLQCHNNSLATLDVTQCPNLGILYCYNNRLTVLDLTNNEYISFDRIVAEGNGNIGISYYYDTVFHECYACRAWAVGDCFLGWYNEDGALLSTDTEFDFPDESVLIAKFSEAIPGDVDGNGSVNANDALAVLRAALGIGADVGSAGDVNGDGVVNANDALMILRAALGLITL